MVRGPLARILSRLAEFPRNLETAWDVPRDICLPGLAEYLGVVRSALHAPITELIELGYVIERKAHVIGGGSRKRKVYHITELGRENSSSNLKRKEKVGSFFGDLPERQEIIGRDDLISDILQHDKVILKGLPGIGKTSILHEISLKFVEKGKTVRYSTMESFKDIADIFADWGLEYTDEEAVLANCKNDVLIIDEFQETNQRHQKRIKDFCKKCKLMILATRPPTLFSNGFEVIEVPPLPLESAVKLLPPKTDDKELIVSRLGCHPLAIQLHDISSVLPEEGEDLQSWVKDVILQDLSEQMSAVNELSMLPVPVLVENLKNEDKVPDLDEYALLRWYEHGVELQHLVRNVNSTNIAVEDYQNAADYWKTIEGDSARLVELFLRIKSGQDIENFLMANAESLMVRSSAGLASLIDDAISRKPSENLHRIAAIVAIERGEADIAENHVSQINADDLQHSLNLLQGKDSKLSDSVDDVKLILSEASRIIDDQLPDSKKEIDVGYLLDKISLNSLDENKRKVVLVAIAKIRHAAFVASEKWSQANDIIENLIAISHEKDPQVVQMKLRSKISETPENSPSFEKLVNEVFKIKGIRGKMLQISLIAKCDEKRGKNLLEKVTLPDLAEQSNLNSARRLSASIWYLRAKFQTHNRFSSMAEAISLWKKSLCPNASRLAADLIHKMI